MAVSVRVEGDIPLDLKVKNGDKFLFISKDQQAFTHSLHKYPAKFFPELPRWLIQRYSEKGDRILDPFMGSGTTNLESMLCGRDSVGVDIDPFSRFLSKVKTTPIRSDRLEEVRKRLHVCLDRYRGNEKFKSPEFPYRENWFSSHVLNELAYIKQTIEKEAPTQHILDFLLICFSSIIRKVSEADDNCTRTVIRKNRRKDIKVGYALKFFKTRLDKAVSSMASFTEASNGCRVKIPRQASAIDMSIFQDKQFDLAITSPPYVNAVDYPRTHQLEMYWLGLASGSLAPLKRRHVGTEVVRVENYRELHKTGIKSADGVLKKIYKIDPRRAYIASKYVSDMSINLKEVYRVLNKRGRYVVVVGSNMIRGNTFENWKYIKESALQIGFEVEVHFISIIINHFIRISRKERIEEDHVLVLRK